MMEDKITRLLRERTAPYEDMLNGQNNIPIYARVPVYCQGLLQWCAANLDTYLDPAEHEYHITVCYSKEPVNITAVPLFKPIDIDRNGYGRHLARYGGSLVLVLDDDESKPLHRIWQAFNTAGASWDFPSYSAHISLSTMSKIPEDMLDTIVPYTGNLTLGAVKVDAMTDGSNGAEKPHLVGKYRPLLVRK